MRNAMLFSLLLTVAVDASAQAPAPAQPKPPSPAPAQPPSNAPAKPPSTQAKPPSPAPPQPRPPATARPAAQPAGRSGLAITATTPEGATLPGVHVDVTGPTARSGVTNASGQVNFPGIQPGTYRLRFSGDTVTTFEREMTLRAGQIGDVDVTLHPAPPPREVQLPPAPAPAPALPPPAAVGPVGKPQVVSIVDLVERELISGKEPRKETLVACSGNTRTLLVQLNQPQATRVYEGAESLYYVVAGEGGVTVGDRDVPVKAGAYVSVPRGTSHSLTRQGRRPLILLALLSGEPCEQAR